MSSVGAAGRRPGGPTRSREWLTHPRVRRLVGWAIAGVAGAIVTGPEGRLGSPAYSVSQSLRPAHLFVVVAIFVAVGLLAEVWLGFRHLLSGRVAATRSVVQHAWELRPVRPVTYLVLLALVLVLPGILLGDYWQGVLVEDIGIYALLSVGLNVVVGFAGLLDLGYIAFYAIGAYTTAYVTGTLPVKPPFTMNPFLAIPVAIAAAMLAGLILGAPTLRLRGDYLAIVTLGFGEIITILAVNLDSITNGARGAFGIPPFSVHAGPIKYDWGLGSLPYYYLLVGFGIVLLVLFHLLENSRVGRAWIAIREDEIAAEACGIAPVKYKLMAFAIGASTSGFAGVLYASKISYINPSSFTVSFSILVLVLVIFGGMGSMAGAIVGAAVLQTVFAYVRKNNTVDPQDIYIYVGAVLIVMMIFRPQGIVPSRRREREIGLAEHGIGHADATGAPSGSPT